MLESPALCSKWQETGNFRDGSTSIPSGSSPVLYLCTSHFKHCFQVSLFRDLLSRHRGLNPSPNAIGHVLGGGKDVVREGTEEDGSHFGAEFLDEASTTITSGSSQRRTSLGVASSIAMPSAVHNSSSIQPAPTAYSSLTNLFPSTQAPSTSLTVAYSSSSFIFLPVRT